MIEVPRQLKNPTFRFLRLQKKEKKPIAEEQNWQEDNLSFDNKKLLEHLKKDLNYAIIGGYGNLIFIDADTKEIEELAEKLTPTFTIKTGAKEPYKKHYFFISNRKMKAIRLSKEKIGDLGDVRGVGQYVVAPNSIHPSGNKYKVIKDLPIAKIWEQQIRELFKEYIDETKPTEIGEYPIITTKRSSDFIRECKVPDYVINNKMKSGTSKNWELFPYLVDILYNREVSQSVYVALCKRQGHNIGAIKGWVKKAHEGKLMKTSCRKMKEHLQRFHPELIDEICRGCSLYEEKIVEEKLEGLYTDRDLLDYKPEPQQWLIENQIPKGEVGLLVGKRGERKTFLGLYQALCLGSGKDCIEDKVPKPKSIIIIDEETGINAMAQRIKILKKGLGLENIPLNINYFSFSGLKLDRRDSKFESFMNHIDEFKPDLIIVDCLQRSVTFEVDKDNAKISELFTEVVRPSIQKYGCSWLFIHHLRKSPAIRYAPEDYLDEVRGGSELVNYCRFILMCQAPKGQAENLIVFRVLKMSNSPIPEPKVISFINEEGSLKISYEGIPEEVLASEVRCANAIKEWLFDEQISEFKTGKIHNAAEKIGYKTTLLNEGLKFLLRQEFLEKIKRGYWKVKGDISQAKL